MVFVPSSRTQVDVSYEVSFLFQFYLGDEIKYQMGTLFQVVTGNYIIFNSLGPYPRVAKLGNAET